MKRSYAVSAVATLLLSTALTSPAFAAGDAAAGLQAMRELNMIVTNDAQVNSSEVEGKAFVGGNLSGSINVGIGNGMNTPPNINETMTSSSRPTLTVGGANTANVKIHNGAAGQNASVGSPSASIGGSSGEVIFNGASPSLLEVGGNYNSGGTEFKVYSGMVANVGGSVNAGKLVVFDGASVKVGGNVNTRIQGGNNSVVRVGGNATNGADTNHSQLYLGGQLQGGGNLNNGTVVQQNLGASTALGGFPVITTDWAGQKAAMNDNLLALSGELAGLTGGVNLAFPGQNGLITPYDMGDGFAVYNITGGDNAFNTLSSLTFSMGTSPVTTIINVSGSTNYDLRNVNLNWTKFTNQSVIWNFINAQNIYVNGWHGSILAPTATLYNYSAIEGSIAVKNIVQSGEIHLGNFAGVDRMLAVPEPATWAMMLTGFFGIGAALRASRRRSALTAA